MEGKLKIGDDHEDITLELLVTTSMFAINIFTQLNLIVRRQSYHNLYCLVKKQFLETTIYRYQNFLYLFVDSDD